MRKHKHTITTWDGCYPSNWNGKIVPEAMSHPAKYSSRLIRKIYEHHASLVRNVRHQHTLEGGLLTMQSESKSFFSTDCREERQSAD